MADLLTVDPGYENAIAAALGPLADAAAVESVDVAVDAIRMVRAEDAGSARMVIAAGDGPPPEPAPPTGTWARDLVHTSAELRPTIEKLLHQVVVVEGLALQRRHVDAYSSSSDKRRGYGRYLCQIAETPRYCVVW